MIHRASYQLVQRCLKIFKMAKQVSCKEALETMAENLRSAKLEINILKQEKTDFKNQLIDLHNTVKNLQKQIENAK